MAYQQWCFTINNPNDYRPAFKPDDMAFMCYGIESAANRTGPSTSRDMFGFLPAGVLIPPSALSAATTSASLTSSTVKEPSCKTESTALSKTESTSSKANSSQTSECKGDAQI